MRIQIDIHGHQSFRCVEGEVLFWGSTVEAFDQGRDHLTVPCVIVRHDNNDIECVSLKTDSRWTVLRALPS